MVSGRDSQRENGRKGEREKGGEGKIRADAVDLR
jgi:hypothetical protein